MSYFNVYGTKQNINSEYAAVIPKFIVARLKNETLTIYGDGLQTRDFIYVKDIVKANRLALRSSITVVYNIGSGREISTLIGNRVEIVHLPVRPGNVRHSVADISKIINKYFRI